MPIHLVFHTSLLKPYTYRHGEPEPLLGPIALNDSDATDDRYEVEAVIARKKDKQ
jgi:hypothetical protein